MEKKRGGSEKIKKKNKKRERKCLLSNILKKVFKNRFWLFVLGFLISFLLSLFWIRNNFYQEYIKVQVENDALKTKLDEILTKKEIEKKEKKEWEKMDNLLIGKSVYVKKIGGEELYKKNSSSLLPIASLTKIVNAIIGIESGEKNVVLTRKALRSEGEYGLLPYEVFSLNDAISFMMIGSVNDIASAISYSYKDIYQHWRIFLSKMNTFVKNHNMKNTIFFSETGLDVNDHILGSYSTAEDIAKIVEYFYLKYPEYAKNTAQVETTICSDKKCHLVRNTNKILEKYPNIEFTKTGYTRKSGGSVAIVYDFQGEKYLIVVLGSTKEGRFLDLDLLINRIKNQYKIENKNDKK